jgi:autotransporter-associated beta strand protein
LSGTGTVTNQSGQGAVLTAGNDNSSTTFNGVVQNGGFSLALNKVGTGTLVLAGNNTYTGGTTIRDGSLQVGSGGFFLETKWASLMSYGMTSKLLQDVLPIDEPVNPFASTSRMS